MATRKVRGGVIETTQPNQEIIDDNNPITIMLLEDVTLENMLTDDIHCRINYGDEILLMGKEKIKIDGLQIDSIIIKEVGSKVRYMGIE